MFAQIFSLSALTSCLVLSSAVIGTTQVMAGSEDTHYPSTATTLSHEQVKQLGQEWGTALSSGDPNQVVSLYDQEAVLLATFKDELDTPDEINNYFIGLTKKPDLKVVFNTQNVRVLDEDTAINSGLYTFYYTENGKTVEIPARYVFVYEKRSDGWTIVDHHSSTRPEQELIGSK